MCNLASGTDSAELARVQSVHELCTNNKSKYNIKERTWMALMRAVAAEM